MPGPHGTIGFLVNAPPFTASELGSGTCCMAQAPSEKAAQVITESCPLNLVLLGPFWGL